MLSLVIVVATAAATDGNRLPEKYICSTILTALLSLLMMLFGCYRCYVIVVATIAAANGNSLPEKDIRSTVLTAVLSLLVMLLLLLFGCYCCYCCPLLLL